MLVLDPSHEDKVVAGPSAPRLGSLDGAVVGVISNGKDQTVPFFDEMERILREKHRVADVIRVVKPNYSAPAPSELIDQSRGWDAVLTGVGD